MLLLVIVVTLSALGDRGTITAMLAIAVPFGAILLAPFGGFVSARARTALAWASVPWVVGVGVCAYFGPLGIPFIARSVVPAGEPSPVAPLSWLALVPLAGLLFGALRLAIRRMSVDVRKWTTACLVVGLVSNVAASITLARPSTDTWIETHELVLTVPSAVGRHVLPLGEGHAIEVVQEPPYAAVAWIRDAESVATPCAWPSGESGERAECPIPVYATDSPIVVRRFDAGWLVGDDAIGLDGTTMDVAPAEVADQLSIPLPLVVAGWLGWLLAIAIVCGAPTVLRHRKLEHLREPSRSYAVFHRAFVLLLVLATQAPLVAAWLRGF